MIKNIPSLILPKNAFGVTTPLRYPGGKSALTSFLSCIITQSKNDIKKYVEPYAGGAGAGISLLLNGVVDGIVINDYDPAVYSFWKYLIEDPEGLIHTIERTPVTIDEWKHQQITYKNDKDKLSRKLGFSFFFLNRTNRSGIAKAGVIGGWDQSGSYKIDARFNKEVLVKKIRAIAQFRDKITVMNQDGAKIFADYAAYKNTLIYVDPPYVEQGKNLYLNAFDEPAHRDLAATINVRSGSNWILTYDENSLINEIYAERPQYSYTLSYSAQTKRKASESLICSDTLKQTVDSFVISSSLLPT